MVLASLGDLPGLTMFTSFFNHPLYHRGQPATLVPHCGTEPVLTDLTLSAEALPRRPKMARGELSGGS